MTGMTNEAVNGVIAALVAAYPNVPIYDEPVPQEAKEPCFFVRSVSPRQRLFLNRRYHRTELIEVVYFPKKENPREDANEVLEQLFNILEMIQVGQETIRGADMEATVEDETGVFTVYYRYFAVRPRDKNAEPDITEIKLKGVTLR